MFCPLSSPRSPSEGLDIDRSVAGGGAHQASDGPTPVLAPRCQNRRMDEDSAKDYLHSDLREVREVMLWKLDGLSEYDIRRPLTSTGTNLLGLVKHLSIAEVRYFGDVFDRPFSEHMGRRDALPSPP